ncbi:MAG: dihydropteroate synthase [Bacteroidota bacterium]
MIYSFMLGTAKIFQYPHLIRAGERLIPIDRNLVMGIINVTPDSFYGGSRYSTQDMVRLQAQRMIEDGSDILDIGACSTRPGSGETNAKTEKNRLDSALSVIRTDFPDILLSVDTYRSGIADWAITEYNVQIINDISGGNLDPDIYRVVGKHQVVYILMHMLGTPRIMQDNPVYKEVVGDISLYFSEKINLLRDAGVTDIWLDPGFGFGKTIKHNYTLLNHLPDFLLFERPIVVGISRKSMIYKVLKGAPESALNGTSILHTIALLKGAGILRAHDVRQARECIQLVNLLTA